MTGAASRVVRRSAAAIVLAGALAMSGAASAEPVPSAGAPGPAAKDSLLPKQELDTAASRKEILRDLYQRLSETPDEESAEVVSSAIEKLWQRSGSNTVDLLMSRVGELLEDKDFDHALEILNSIVSLAPEYPEGWTRRAAVFFARKDFGKSLEDLRHALTLDPSHYKAIQGLGLLMQELGDKEAALKAFRRVLKVHPYLDDVRQAVQELSREVEGQRI